MVDGCIPVDVYFHAMAQRGISDSQANAEAVARRGTPYSAASDQSFRIQWDWHRREPRDLREAVSMIRRAHADEVPEKLHDGHRYLADDGTPRMTARATGYLFGRADSEDVGRDPETGRPDLVGFYHSPFKATIHRMSVGSGGERKRASIAVRVANGGGPIDAATSEGVPLWCARVVAMDALMSTLREITNLKLHLERLT